jgi:Yip1 domain
VDTITPLSEPEAEMSFSDKIVNVISAPGELFLYVAREGKKSANYSIPLLLSIVVSIIFMFVVFSQPAVKDQMAEQQDKVMQQQVEKGKMTAEQYEKAKEFTPKPGSPIFLIAGTVGVVFVMLILVFGSAFAYWLVGKYAFKTIVPYGKVAEVVGLSLYVMIIGSIVTMIIAVAMGSINAGPHLGLLVGSFDPTNRMHKLLASINIFTIWNLVVVAIGLSKIFSITEAKAYITVGVLWVLYIVATIGVNIGG